MTCVLCVHVHMYVCNCMCICRYAPVHINLQFVWKAQLHLRYDPEINSITGLSLCVCGVYLCNTIHAHIIQSRHSPNYILTNLSSSFFMWGSNFTGLVDKSTTSYPSEFP